MTPRSTAPIPPARSALPSPSWEAPRPAEVEHGLPRRARALIAAVSVTGALSQAVAVADVARQPLPATAGLEVLVVFGAVIAGSWLWPLIIYRGKESESVQLDEAVLVILALLVPAGWAVVAFGGATVVAQLARRRAIVKTLFNFGQVSTAVGLAVLINHALVSRSAPLSMEETAAATLAALVFFVVNSGSVTAILAATGTPWRTSVLDGMVVRLSLVGAGALAGVLLALTISAYRWSLPVGVLMLVVLRRVLAAQFSGRHDRERLRGLLAATLLANRNLRQGDVFDAIFSSARDLLRCRDVSIRDTAPGPHELAARLSLDGEVRWLVASGRSRAEPFDSADAALLETLAAIGAGALTNALLYHQVGYERERLAAITSSLAEGVCAIDAGGAVIFSNPAAARLLGWVSVGTPATSGSADGVTPTFLSEPAQRAMDSQQVIRDEDATFYGDEGHPLPVAFTVSAIINGGLSVGAVMAFRDLTDQKVLEAERTRTQSEREELESRLHQSQRLESLGELAGGIAHDFNNLLGVISNYAAFVGERVSEAAAIPGGDDWSVAGQDLEQIEKAARRAAELTHQLLAFARREVVQPQVLNLNDLVVGVEQLLGRTLGTHITVITSLAADLGPIMADPGQIEQVLVNLAVNARDAMPRGGTLTIDTSDVEIDRRLAGPEPELSAGRYARLRVSDTGIGIPKSVIDRVFEPFFTTKAKDEGSGLGLATVHGIVAQAGGRLRISSEPDVGTTLTALFPVTDQPLRRQRG